MISIPDEPGGHVTGNMKIGAEPRMALTGFSGAYMGPGDWEASGSNTRGQGLDQMHLSVVVRGNVAPDRKTITGSVYAVINGSDQPEWTFVGAEEGEDLPTAPIASTGAVGVTDTTLALQQQGLLARLSDAIPAPLKIAAGVGLAALGGTYLYRRVKG
jgi:hypothetical protein